MFYTEFLQGTFRAGAFLCSCTLCSAITNHQITPFGLVLLMTLVFISAMGGWWSLRK